MIPSLIIRRDFYIRYLASSIQYLAPSIFFNMLSLNFSPFPLIETERLLLRPASLEDAPEIYFLRTDEKMIRYTNRAPDGSIEETKNKIRQILQMQENNESIMWGISLKDNPATLIGTIGYWRIIPEHYRAEIGYLLHPSQWEKGIMKEALNAVIEYAFKEMKLHSIEANINPDNIPSAALLEACGFIKEAYHKENYYFDEVFYDSLIYSKLNK